MEKSVAVNGEQKAGPSESEVREFVSEATRHSEAPQARRLCSRRLAVDELAASPRSLAGQANLIGILQEVQDRFGYLPRLALEEISRRTKIPLSRVWGVVTFYAQFYTEPRARHTVRCCRGTACHVKGASRVLEAVKETLGVKEGETSGDMMFFVETVACLGTCFLAPVMMIDQQYFGLLNPQKVERILRSYGDQG